MVLRYLYLLRSSWSRVLELIYWPAVQMFVWGFLQFYISQNSGFFARAAGMFIGAVLMWDILFRGQLGFSVSFLEEMWSRNLANVMISPAAADRVRRRVDGDEHRAPGGRHDPGHAARHLVFRFQYLQPRLCARGVLPQSHPDELVGRHRRVRRGHAQRHGRGKPRLDGDVPADAVDLRLLSGVGAAAHGCKGSPGRCRRLTCSRACGRWCSSRPSAPT